jgi:hypothetical protein
MRAGQPVTHRSRPFTAPASLQGDGMTIFMWTLSGLAALTLIAYMIIPVARAIKNIGKQHDLAEVLYPGNRALQSGFRDKVASDILRNNAGVEYGSSEFKDLYQQEMDRLLEEYGS